MEYKTLESHLVYSGRVFDVHTEKVQTPAGSTMQIDLVSHAGAVAIIAVDDDENVLLVRQYRHPTGKTLLELPAGTLEQDEEPAVCARRESREEIGHDPGELIHIGAGFMAPGYSTEYIYFFLARQLTPAPLPGDDDEDIQVERLPLSQLGELVRAGKVEDVKTIAGLSLVSAYFGTEKPR
jgi:ADP-ribose pyrophosphatase